MPKTSWAPPTIGLGSKDRSTPAPTATPTIRFRRCNLAAEAASAVGVGVVLSRDVPGTCLPGKDGASDELCLRQLCVQSLSACLGVRLCKSPHQTFRTTNIGGDSAQVHGLAKLATIQSSCTGGSPLLLSKQLCSNMESSARESDLRKTRDPERNARRKTPCHLYASASVLLSSLC